MRLGVDFGGTKIEAALLDSKGEILRAPACPQSWGLCEPLCRAVADLTARIEQETGARAATGWRRDAGLAVAGDRHDAQRQLGLAQRQTVFEDLKVALKRPVRVENDANCFALSEAVDGAAAAGRVVFGVIIGTGCGGGVVVDRKGDRRRQRHWRRMGPHAAAVGARRRGASRAIGAARWGAWSNGFPAPASSAGRA